MSTVLMTLLFFPLACHISFAAPRADHHDPLPDQYYLVPYPQEVNLHLEKLTLSSVPEIIVLPGAGEKEKLAQDQLRTFFQTKTTLPRTNRDRVRIVLASLVNPSEFSRWPGSREAQTLNGLNPQGYILRVEKKQITIFGHTGQGTLYGVQTLIQILSQSIPALQIPLMKIVDYPEVPDRYIDVTFAWYAHYGSINLGFGTQLWTEQEWTWFIDWCLAHKINGVDLCIYGYWPFEFADYQESTLVNIPVKTFFEQTGGTKMIRLAHPNVEHQFLPGLVRYAQARGIRVNAYIGLNTFNGGYAREHPEAQIFPGKDYALDLSNGPARRYLRESLRKIMRMGFDGITFEMIELPSSVCTKPACISTYWEGFKDDTLPNSNPKLTPLMVRIRADADILNDLYHVIIEEKPAADIGLIYHRIVEMYGWREETLRAFKQFRGMIPKSVYFLQGPRAPRNGSIEGSDFEKWVDIANSKTYRHSDNIGGDAAFYNRLLYINNDPETRGDEPVASLQWEIAQHRAAAKLQLRGATGYGFEWYGDEIYPLILSQYSWRSRGPDNVSDHEFLEYGSRSMYGKLVGSLVARILALSPPPTDHYPSRWVNSANTAADLAKEALEEYSGSEPQYRQSLEQIRTATRRKADLYELERLEELAKNATGNDRSKLLRDALVKAEQVADLIITGKPRLNYFDCYGEHGFRIFAAIKKLAEELGVSVPEKFKAAAQQ